ncbi:MAG: hypothetical protein AAB410_00805 [Patescibacteria group bacterium]
MKTRKKSKKIKPIKFRQSLFWDIRSPVLNPIQYKYYIVERILDYGDDREIKWMWNYYPKNLIHKIAKNARVLRPQTRPLWMALTK